MVLLKTTLSDGVAVDGLRQTDIKMEVLIKL